MKGRLEGGTSFFGDAPRFFYCVYRGALDSVEELGLVVREPSELRGVEGRTPWWEAQYSSQFLAYPADLLGLAEFPENLPPSESSVWTTRS